MEIWHSENDIRLRIPLPVYIISDETMRQTSLHVRHTNGLWIVRMDGLWIDRMDCLWIDKMDSLWIDRMVGLSEVNAMRNMGK